MILNSPYISGSSTITGNLLVLGSITGSINSAISASYSNNATSASYALNATSASFALVATSASYAANADLLDGRDSLTFANTGSNNFVGTQNINGAVAITGSLTTTGAITAQTLNVQQVTSSIVYSSGSNIFGNSVSNTQSMTGSVDISGSLTVTGDSTITGVLTLNSTISNGTYTYTLPSATGTLALTSALSGYVPYTGANQTLAMGTNNGITLTDTGSNVSISITSSSTATGAIYVNKSGAGTGIQVANNGTGFGFYANNISTGYGIAIGNSSTGKGLYIDNAAAATGDPFVYTLGGAAFVKAKIDYLGNITGVALTLTGALGGTSASFSSTLASTGELSTSSGLIAISGSGSNPPTGGVGFRKVSGSLFIYPDSTSLRIRNNANTVDNLTITEAGAATFSSTIAASGRISTSHSTSGDYAAVFYNSSATGEGVTVRGGSTASHNAFIVQPYNGATTLFNILATGAATFSSSVTAGDSIRINKSSNSGSASTFPVLEIKNSLATQGDGSSTFNFASLYVNSGNDAVNMVVSTTYAAGTWAPAGIIAVTTNHGLQFKTNNTLALTIASTGEATFSGTVTSPSVLVNGVAQNVSALTPKFQVLTNVSADRNNALVYFANDANSAILSFAKSRSGTVGTITYPSGSDYLGRIFFTGANEATSRFDVNGDISMVCGSTWSASNRETKLEITGTPNGATGRQTNLILAGNGDLTITGSNATKASGTAWINPSDLRLKMNINKYPKGLAEILKINPKTWYFNEASGLDTTKKHVSPIAQELQEVMPEMVSTYKGKLNEKENDLLQIDSSDITWLLVNAIKELNAKITELENK